MQRFNTLFIGKVLQHFPQLASTNAHAQELLSKTKPAEGTVISAFHQYDGRGQIGSKWESEAGKNLTLSIILYPTFLAARLQFQLNQLVSLSLFDLVSEHIPGRVSIKWPNDIYVGDKKIAGILIQNTVFKEYLSSSVIGIGLNVNQSQFLTNPPNPTSFNLETNRTFELGDVSEELYYRLEKRYLALKFGKSAEMQEDYISRLYRFRNEAVYARPDSTTFNGTITGIDERGRLLVETGCGLKAFDLKEIKFV